MHRAIPHKSVGESIVGMAEPQVSIHLDIFSLTKKVILSQFTEICI